MVDDGRSEENFTADDMLIYSANIDTSQNMVLKIRALQPLERLLNIEFDKSGKAYNSQNVQNEFDEAIKLVGELQNNLNYKFLDELKYRDPVSYFNLNKILESEKRELGELMKVLLEERTKFIEIVEQGVDSNLTARGFTPKMQSLLRNLYTSCNNQYEWRSSYIQREMRGKGLKAGAYSAYVDNSKYLDWDIIFPERQQITKESQNVFSDNQSDFDAELWNGRLSTKTTAQDLNYVAAYEQRVAGKKMASRNDMQAARDDVASKNAKARRDQPPSLALLETLKHKVSQIKVLSDKYDALKNEANEVNQGKIIAINEWKAKKSAFINSYKARGQGKKKLEEVAETPIDSNQDDKQLISFFENQGISKSDAPATAAAGGGDRNDESFVIQEDESKLEPYVDTKAKPGKRLDILGSKNLFVGVSAFTKDFMNFFDTEWGRKHPVAASAATLVGALTGGAAFKSVAVMHLMQSHHAIHTVLSGFAQAAR